MNGFTVYLYDALTEEPIGTCDSGNLGAVLAAIPQKRVMLRADGHLLGFATPTQPNMPIESVQPMDHATYQALVDHTYRPSVRPIDGETG